MPKVPVAVLRRKGPGQRTGTEMAPAVVVIEQETDAAGPRRDRADIQAALNGFAASASGAESFAAGEAGQVRPSPACRRL
jgi:hypothetical protein